MKILFCNIGWMKHYCGIHKNDQIYNGGAFVVKNKAGAEEFNFADFDGKYYGYVAMPTNNDKRSQIHIERYPHTTNKDLSIDNVLVVWVATRPNSANSSILGWYKDATVYRHYQGEGPHLYYNIEADPKNCVLLPLSKRTFTIYRASKIGIGKGFGQSNIWFAQDDEAKPIIENVIKYIEDFNEEERLNKFTSKAALKKPAEDKDLTVETAWELAREKFNRGEFLKSLEYMNYVVEKKDLTEEILILKARALQELKHYTESIKCLRKVIELNPNSGDAFFFKGIAYYSLWLPEKAYKNFDKAIEINDKDHEAYYYKSWTHFYTGQSKVALKEMKNAWNVDKENEKYKKDVEFLESLQTPETNV